MRKKAARKRARPNKRGQQLLRLADVVGRAPARRSFAEKLRGLAIRQADPDEDPAGLAEALDAVLDEAVDALQNGDTAQALALITAAEATVDELLGAVGGTDADEEEDEQGTGSGSPLTMPLMVGSYAAKGSKEARAHGQPARIEERADGSRHVVGHSAVFNQLSVDLGWFREEILPGAFDDALRAYPVTALANHNEDRMFATTLDGSLALSLDDVGLYMDGNPVGTSIARDIVIEVETGFYPGQSFSFTVASDSWRLVDGVDVRSIVKFERIFDVGPVLWPAYPQTDVGMRGLYGKMFEPAGIDFDGLASAFVRKYRGLALSSADRDILRRAVSYLSDLDGAGRQEPAGAPAGEGAASEAWRATLNRRRLDLAGIS